jgi:hypothetical protein
MGSEVSTHLEPAGINKLRGSGEDIAGVQSTNKAVKLTADLYEHHHRDVPLAWWQWRSAEINKLNEKRGKGKGLTARKRWANSVVDSPKWRRARSLVATASS